MKATGVVRKLDNLGRLVIPKEIRKQYGLKEGDSVEFFTEEDSIVIQRFNTLSKHIEQIRIMCETLENILGNSVLFIHDENNCIYNKKPKELFIRSIRQIRKVLDFEREVIFEDESDTYNGRVYPIVVNGESFGAFVIIYDNHKLSKEELITAEAFVKVLTRQHQ